MGESSDSPIPYSHHSILVIVYGYTQFISITGTQFRSIPATVLMASIRTIWMSPFNPSINTVFSSIPITYPEIRYPFFTKIETSWWLLFAFVITAWNTSSSFFHSLHMILYSLLRFFLMLFEEIKIGSLLYTSRIYHYEVRRYCNDKKRIGGKNPPILIRILFRYRLEFSRIVDRRSNGFFGFWLRYEIDKLLFKYQQILFDLFLHIVLQHVADKPI